MLLFPSLLASFSPLSFFLSLLIFFALYYTHIVPYSRIQITTFLLSLSPTCVSSECPVSDLQTSLFSLILYFSCFLSFLLFHHIYLYHHVYFHIHCCRTFKAFGKHKVSEKLLEISAAVATRRVGYIRSLSSSSWQFADDYEAAFRFPGF